MKTLLTFGDSNTHGTPPILVRGEMRRFGPEARWPCVALGLLGAGWHLVEEGLPGRTARFADPLMGAHMDGTEGLKMALASHGPIDVLAIMLGTNDIKARYGASPELIAGGISCLLDLATSIDAQARHPAMKILLICPPPVLEQGPIRDEFYGARARSLQLPPLYAAMAAARGIGFLDAGTVMQVSPVDGIHFEPEGQQALGRAAAAAIRAL